MNKVNLFLISILIGSFAFLSGCQKTLPPERPLNTGDRHIIKKKEDTLKQEVLPTLTITKGDKKSEMKLRSQSSRYLNAEKTILEINLTSSNLAYCQNDNPPLNENEEKIKITVKSVDGKTPIEKVDLATDKRFVISSTYNAKFVEPENQEKLINIDFDKTAIKELNITDINNAIIRGKLKILNKDMSIEGDFFTAICV